MADLFPRGNQPQATVTRPSKPPQPAIELRISVRGGVYFQMEHHPLEVLHPSCRKLANFAKASATARLVAYSLFVAPNMLCSLT